MRTTALSMLGLIPCVASSLSAQQGTSSIAGKVTDAQGGMLPGVNIVVTNEDTGVFREVITGPEGSYAVTQIVPGRYRITATLAGFKVLDRRGVSLTVGQTSTLNLAMEVGGFTETLTVTGEAPLVDVSSATVGGHISADELNDLPSANRNCMAFVGNVPGTVFVPSAEFLNDTFQANGQSAAANNIVFDGANNTDEQRGSNVGGQTRAANEAVHSSPRSAAEWSWSLFAPPSSMPTSNPIAELTKDDFVVLENGASQQVDTISAPMLRLTSRFFWTPVRA